MRLINVQTLDFEEFEDETAIILRYGILSHRWADEEVTYQDAVIHGLNNVEKKGIAKIRGVCRLALASDLCYVWVDTCCIDKTSSAELSEAINSMFRWYQQAHTCFAYLGDIEFGSAPWLSLWFSRAWTLQELIAPQNVLFYSKDWQPLGSKADLADGISLRTGIPHNVLKNKVNIYSLPIAQRMSWAGRRKARRVEDIAYSLLGIFDVNMPLLYGEGSKAFRRLQEEIIKQSNDHTIFLWVSKARDVGKLLAPSPDSFEQSRVFRFRPSQKGKRPFSVTNIGLSITLPLIPWHVKTYLALLDCEIASSATIGDWRQPALYLQRIRDSDIFENMNISSRGYGFAQNADPKWTKIRDLYIAIDPAGMARDSTKLSDNVARTNYQTHEDEELYGFVLRSIEVHNDIFSLCDISTKHVWDPENRVLEMPAGTAGDAAVIHLPQHPLIPAAISAVKLGYDFDFYPCCVVGVAASKDTFSEQEHKRLALHSGFKGFLEAVDLSQEHDWFSPNQDDVIPQSSNGYWLLKADLLLGCSLWLVSPSHRKYMRSHCFAGSQIHIRLTRESYRGKIAWMFDLQISQCPGSYCSNH